MIDAESFRHHCLLMPGAVEALPFGPDTLVFKVGGKIFAMMALEGFPTTVNLKCDPERAIELRADFDAIVPGYHMNKDHWNTVSLDGSLSDKLVLALVDHSYELVFNSLTKRAKTAIETEAKPIATL